MFWFVFAFATAFFDSLKDVFSKLALKKDIDVYTVAWALRIYATPFNIILLLIIGIPEIQSKFWLALVCGGTCNIFATLLYMKALKVSDISLTVPLIALSPLFLMITSPLMLGSGEIPAPIGIVGIFLIVFGSYVLNLKSKNKSLLAPFKALVTEKGPRYMLFVALIWSLSANFDKMGVQNSSPILWVTAIQLFIVITMIPIIKAKSELKTVFVEWRSLLPFSPIVVIMLLSQMYALTLTIVPYVIAVKRTSTIMTVLWGKFLFKEKSTITRLIGSCIMVFGLILIVLS